MNNFSVTDGWLTIQGDAQVRIHVFGANLMKHILINHSKVDIDGYLDDNFECKSEVLQGIEGKRGGSSLSVGGEVEIIFGSSNSSNVVAIYNIDQVTDIYSN